MYARMALCLMSFIVLLTVPAWAQDQGHDYAPFAKIDGFKRGSYKEVRFDFYDFKTTDGKTTRVEGKKITIFYRNDAHDVSGIEMKRTLLSQAKSPNVEVLNQSGSADDNESADPFLVVKITKPDVTSYVAATVDSMNGYITIIVVEQKVLVPKAKLSEILPSGSANSSASNNAPPLGDSTGRPRVAAGSTEGLLDATGKPIQAPIAPTLKATGHVQVYINFVTDSAQLQPSSAPVLDELATTLKAIPDLKVDLIGHTDAVGSDAHNQDLSKRRAASVYLWLVQHGIARDRLQSEGRGFLEPIATNETADGRALNRRVEVKTIG
jgi:outer membrane protein OmpA-like peptidoglycan-associated protein